MASRTFHKSFDKVFTSCVKALKELDFDITHKSSQKGEISAESGTSLISWGEEIELNIEALGTHKTKVSIESESLQLISWGKDEKNVSKIFTQIESTLN